MFSGEKKSINACHDLGVRPTCPCCGGGAYRKGKTATKYKSKKMSKKAKKPKKNFTRKTIRKDNRIAACTTIRE